MFGCVAYVHVPKDERGKLDSKTNKCVLLGYGSAQKGYRVYDHLTQKVFYSRNIKFDEREIASSPVEEEEPAQHPLILDPINESESSPEEGDEEDGSTGAVVADPLPRRSTREQRPVDYLGGLQSPIPILVRSFSVYVGCVLLSQTSLSSSDFISFPMASFHLASSGQSVASSKVVGSLWNVR